MGSRAKKKVFHHQVLAVRLRLDDERLDLMKGSEDSVEMVISRLVGSRAKKKSYDQV